MVEITPYDYQFRVILIGDPTVGKSSILKQFTEGRFVEQADPTVGVDFSAKMMQIEGKQVKLQLWDTAGHERFRSITKSYYRSAAGALIVYDITNRDSFQHVIHWLEEVKGTAFANGIACLLVGHKIDLNHDRVVETQEAQAFAIEHNMEFIETSAKTTEYVDEAFKKLTTRIYHDIINEKIKIKDGWDGVKVGRRHSISQEITLKSQTIQEPTIPQDTCAC